MFILKHEKWSFVFTLYLKYFQSTLPSSIENEDSITISNPYLNVPPASPIQFSTTPPTGEHVKRPIWYKGKFYMHLTISLNLKFVSHPVIMVFYTYLMLYQILQKSPVLLQRNPGKHMPRSVPSIIIWWEISVQLLTWMKLSMALARKFDTTKFHREKSIDQVGHIIFKDLALTLRKCERWVILRCFRYYLP